MSAGAVAVPDFAAGLPVLDFDPIGSAEDRDHPPYARMLAHPLLWWPDLGAVVVSRHDLVRQVLGDPRCSSGNAVPPLAAVNPPAVLARLAELGVHAESLMLINADGADHDRQARWYRTAVSGRVIAGRRPRMRTLAEQLVTAVAPTGQVELREQIVVPYVAGNVNDLYGYPPQDRHRIAGYCRALEALWTPTAPLAEKMAAAEVILDCEAYHATLIADREREPRDDLLTHLLRGRAAGDLTLPELNFLVRGSRVAAEETTVHLLVSVVDVLLREGLWQEARCAASDDRARLVSRVVEETLRARSPHARLMRITTEPITLAGHPLPAGTQVVCNFAAANQDPVVFPEPTRIDLDRANVRDHVAFGAGTHACPGAGMARTEVRILVNTLLTHLPETLRHQHPDRDAQQVRSWFFLGAEQLHLTWPGGA